RPIHLSHQEIRLMNTPSSLRLKPLAACLAAAFALAPVGALWADPSQTLQRLRTQGASPSHAAAMLASRRTLRQTMTEVAARARAAGPAPPDRPAATTTLTSCDDSGSGTLRDAITNAATGDTIDLSAL